MEIWVKSWWWLSKFHCKLADVINLWNSILGIGMIEYTPELMKTN